MLLLVLPLLGLLMGTGTALAFRAHGAVAGAALALIPARYFRFTRHIDLAGKDSPTPVFG